MVGSVIRLGLSGFYEKYRALRALLGYRRRKTGWLHIGTQNPDGLLVDLMENV